MLSLTACGQQQNNNQLQNNKTEEPTDQLHVIYLYISGMPKVLSL